MTNFPSASVVAPIVLFSNITFAAIKGNFVSLSNTVPSIIPVNCLSWAFTELE